MTRSSYPNPLVVICLLAGALVFPLALYGMSIGLNATVPMAERVIRAVFGEIGDDAHGVFAITCIALVWFGTITGVPVLVQIAFDARSAKQNWRPHDQDRCAACGGTGRAAT